mmetsp:Transcript_16095/g.15496  ORF Transcript_16095/g.15496 Transcript_16095/m.15496 type:complete len:85 (+) Transcript_16095:546-800(+)
MDLISKLINDLPGQQKEGSGRDQDIYKPQNQIGDIIAQQQIPTLPPPPLTNPLLMQQLNPGEDGNNLGGNILGMQLDQKINQIR